MQELTDVDILNESEEGAEALIEALLEHQVVALLVQNLDRYLVLFICHYLIILLLRKVTVDIAALFVIHYLVQESQKRYEFSCISRLDESVKEEADGVHNTLSIIENLTELRSDISTEAGKQGEQTCF